MSARPPHRQHASRKRAKSRGQRQGEKARGRTEEDDREAEVDVVVP